MIADAYPLRAVSRETIDASMFNTDFLTHSYYADEPAVLDDLRDLINGKKAADRAPRIVPAGDSGGAHFTFANQGMLP